MNFDELIGLNVSVAMELLQENGYNNIKIVNNFTNDSECNETIVCFVKQENEEVTLVCGRFKFL